MKKLKTLLATALLATATSTLVYANSIEQQYQQGVTEYNRQNYRTAFELFKLLAEQGNANSQFNLGVMYEKGQSVQQDDHQAFKWYHKAAEQGHAESQYNLGVMYEKGQGVQQDAHQAFKWYEKAAKQGLANAQFNLAEAYRDKQDYIQAAKWHEKAAEQGHPKAKELLGKGYALLGEKYALGENGLQQDISRSQMWFERACNYGNQHGCDWYRKLNESK